MCVRKRVTLRRTATPLPARFVSPRSSQLASNAMRTKSYALRRSSCSNATSASSLNTFMSSADCGGSRSSRTADCMSASEAFDGSLRRHKHHFRHDQATVCVPPHRVATTAHGPVPATTPELLERAPDYEPRLRPVFPCMCHLQRMCSNKRQPVRSVTPKPCQASRVTADTAVDCWQLVGLLPPAPPPVQHVVASLAATHQREAAASVHASRRRLQWAGGSAC